MQSYGQVPRGSKHPLYPNSHYVDWINFYKKMNNILFSWACDMFAQYKTILECVIV
jgi:hypothetical protein